MNQATYKINTDIVSTTMKDKPLIFISEEAINLKRDNDNLKSIIKEVREFIEENQEEHKYTDRGGFTYTEGHFLRDSDTLLEILDKENNNDTK